MGTNVVYPTGVVLADSTPMHVAIVDGSGDQVTSFGGGTQYADGAARGTATGTLAMVDDGTNIQSIAGDSSGRLKIATIETSITPGVGALNLGKAEDAAHSTGDVGVMALAVRNDGGAVQAGTDGDYVPFTTDATGALRIDMNGTVSSNNSTTVALAGGATFTGTSDDAINYNEIRISVIASHASATDGLSLQQSSDNTNWDITDTYTIPAATGKTYSVPRQARYFRLVYTNGATLQTSFRLQTILNRVGARVSSQRAGDAYTNETDLEQNQVFGMLYNESTWDRQREIANAINTVGTGISAAGLLAQFDDVAPTSITENRFGNLRMSANRNQYVTLRDASGNERGLNIDTNGALAATVTNTTASNLNAQVAGDVAAAATDSGNPVKVGGKYNSTKPTYTDGQRGDLQIGTKGALTVQLSSADSTNFATMFADNADGVVATSTNNKLGVLSRGTVFGGTNWDRSLSIVNATNSVGIGIQAVGLVGQFDDVSPTAITENQFGNLRMSTNRNLYGTVRDAAGNERGLNISSGGNISVDTVTTLTNQTQEGGVNISLNAGAVDTGTRRVVQANGAGKAIVSKGGSAASSGNNTLVVAGTNKLKVFAYSLSTTSTTAMTCIFQDGASGTTLWEVILQAGTSVSTGANLAVSPPAWIFNTSAATLLNLNLSSANAVLWSVSYFDEA